MTKKKLLSLALASVLLLALTACGAKAPNASQSNAEMQGASASEAKTPNGTQSAAGTKEPAASGAANKPANVETVTGGSDQTKAKEVPLDTKLIGKMEQEAVQWFSFTTDETENATYKLTAVNQTVGSRDLSMMVYDAEGKEVGGRYESLCAEEKGTAATLNLDVLPHTTYYIKVWVPEGEVVSYSFCVRSVKGQTGETSRTQPSPEAKDGLAVSAASNQAEAQLLPLNAKLKGKVGRNEHQWFAFSTDSTENGTGRITIVNMTRGAGALHLEVRDSDGTMLPDNFSLLDAEQDGKAVTLDLELLPDTTYYIHVWGEPEKTGEYTVEIHWPDQATNQR